MAAVGGAGSGFVRRKTVTAHNDATMRTVAGFGEFGRITLDEPVPHAGTAQGPSPLQAVLGALCGCEAVTFHRTRRRIPRSQPLVPADHEPPGPDDGGGGGHQVVQRVPV